MKATPRSYDFLHQKALTRLGLRFFEPCETALRSKLAFPCYILDEGARAPILDCDSDRPLTIMELDAVLQTIFTL